MPAIIMRSALEFWGQHPPAELHSIEVGHGGKRRMVTWDEVMAARRKRQAERLRWIRHVEEWRAHKLWVAYFDQNLMGGWQAFLCDWRGRCNETWIDRDASGLKPMLMRVFPLVLPLGTNDFQWELWKQAFARRYERRRQDRRPLGVAICWWDRRGCVRPAGYSRGHGR